MAQHRTQPFSADSSAATASMSYLPRTPAEGFVRQPSALAPTQEHIWRRYLRAHQPAALYHETLTICCPQALDAASLERCFLEIIRRHEPWRTNFDIREGSPIQLVQPAATSVPIAVHDLSALPADARESEFFGLVNRSAKLPFELRDGSLFRAALFKMGEDDFRVSVVTHQLILDGISAYQILPFELAALYAAFSEGRPSSLPALPTQYSDFSEWHRRFVSGSEQRRQLKYWKSQLKAPLPTHRWPHTYSPPGTESFRGTTSPFLVPTELSSRLGEFARAERASLFMILLGSFASLVRSYSEQNDLMIATLSPCGRKHSTTLGLLGYFLNPVALRFDFSGGPTFEEFLRQVRRVLADAISHDDVPIENLAEELGINTGRDPIIKVAISLQPRTPSLDAQWEVTTMDARDTGSPWDLYLAFIEGSSGLAGRVQYNPDVLKESEVAEMLRDLWRVMEAAISNPNVRVAEALRR